MSRSVPAEAGPGGGGEPRSEGLCGPRGGAGLRGISGPGEAAQEVIEDVVFVLDSRSRTARSSGSVCLHGGDGAEDVIGWRELLLMQ